MSSRVAWTMQDSSQKTKPHIGLLMREKEVGRDVPTTSQNIPSSLNHDLLKPAERELGQIKQLKGPHECLTQFFVPPPDTLPPANCTVSCGHQTASTLFRLFPVSYKLVLMLGGKERAGGNLGAWKRGGKCGGTHTSSH